MLIDANIENELINEAGAARVIRGRDYAKKGKVDIEKVSYDNEKNFSIHSIVEGNFESYDVHIEVKNGEIESVECGCQDYYSRYGVCKHKVATAIAFKDYKIKNNKKDLKYNNFKELLNIFYNDLVVNPEEKEKKYGKEYGNVELSPKVIIDTYRNQLRLEFKIGTKKQFYKIKDIIEFYNRINNKEYYSYGLKLEFLHTEEAFSKESKKLLDFILKYAPIMQSVNSNIRNRYGYYGINLTSSYITLMPEATDDLFEILENTYVDIDDTKVLFTAINPDIKFEVEKVSKNEYLIRPNIEVYDGYQVISGKEYTYFLRNNRLYRLNKEFENTTLKLLDIFKKNLTEEIRFSKEYLESFFSIIMPKMKDEIILDNVNKEEIEEYIPKKLVVKLFLDYDELNHILLDVRFCYGDVELNPFNEKENIKVARNVIEETNVLNIFSKTGFQYDREKSRLILVSDEQIYNFLCDDIDLYSSKFEVLVTESFKTKEIKQPKIGTIGLKVENNLLTMDFSQMKIEPSEIREIMKKYELKKKYHRLKNGSFIKLEENEDIKALNQIASGLDIEYSQIEKGKVTLPVHRSLYLNKILNNLENIEIKSNDNYNQITRQIESKGKTENISIPKSLENTLRTYQKTGFKWLKTLDEYNFGGILADDMGLGKTIQILSIILSYIENTPKEKRLPSLVVAPSSLALNWKNEAEKFTSKIKVQVISGKLSDRQEIIKEIPKYDLIITSYDLLKRDIDLYEELNYEFRFMLADEAQYIKNGNTQNAKAIKKINAKTKYALTGTPIENSLAELWSIFDFILPGYLFSYRKFKEKYETPIIKEEDLFAMEKLKMLIEPFILRRTKKQVLTELPDKTISIINNEMEAEQEKIYLSYLSQAKNELTEEISSKGFEKSHIKILALLTRLRQICCHPALFISNYNGESGKLNQCMELVKDAIQGGHKILLFSGYTSMFEIIEKELKKENIDYYKLTGKTKVDERVDLVERFNNSQDVKVFLISLKAGGTGLNLTGADMVIHYDPWWNISVENQATDRAYRIGQKNNVQVYKLITKNSIEEKIYELQKRKEKLVDNMLDTKVSFINQLSKEDIMSLFDN